MSGEDELTRTLRRIDGRGYRAYKDIAGQYDLGGPILAIDYVQGDPFAAPSKVRVRIPLSGADLPAELFSNRIRRVALSDWLARQTEGAIRSVARGRRGSGKSGLITIDAGGQEVLERTAVVLGSDFVEVRLEVGLPAAGRRVLGREAEALLLSDLPEVAERGLTRRHLDLAAGRRFVECVENQEHLRAQLSRRGLAAFVGDGAVLPRESGASDRPMKTGAVPFQAPDALKVELDVLHGEGPVTGMGIPRGVTLIVGGGYHGKSTLLKALERAVYPHVPGDGREWVVTDPRAVKIRAEDGRRVENVDISPFICNLPHERSTTSFCSEDASGSTSQAANIVEAVEVGATTLLLDEDTSATNFMVRDARMQALVHKEDEPITPFLDRVRELYEERGVSTILVMGGSGDYFDVADTVVMMKEYRPVVVTEEAKHIAEAQRTLREREVERPLGEPAARIPLAESFDPSRGRRDVKIDAKSVDLILFGSDPIDLRGVEQLLDRSQTRAVGYALYLAREQLMDGQRTLDEILDETEGTLDAEGLDLLDPRHRPGRHPGNFARPRRFEIAAALNRLRTLRMKQK